MIRRIGLLCSGGDAPGMNACIRAVVRSAIDAKIEVIGFYNGYEGLIHNTFCMLRSETVSGWSARGGTLLKTARSAAFKTPQGRLKAIQTLQLHNLQGLIILGGDGSFKGAQALLNEHAIAVIGIPCTIDNDLNGTDYTIGFDTALNTAVEAIDRIRDTAESHDRIFLIELMGRDSGQLALHAALSGGAEAILVPELKNDFEQLVTRMQNWRSSKSSKIIIVGEGDEHGGALNIANQLKSIFPSLEFRVSVLGHIQRGGVPSAIERINAHVLGVYAIKQLLAGQTRIMVGLKNQSPCCIDLSVAVKRKPELNSVLIETFNCISQ